jgi:dimethylargininase
MTNSRTDKKKKAIVRGVAATYDRCVRPASSREPIDVGLAREQHAAYTAALKQLGFDLVRLDADDRYPDCCFVEDTAVVTGRVAVFCEMGAPPRRGEQAAVIEALPDLEQIRLDRPATLDGGDVIRDGDTLFVGLTERTNRAAVDALAAALDPHGKTVRPVAVSGALHLKSLCTRLGPGLFVITESFARTGAFSQHDLVVIPDEEGYAANCLASGGRAVVSDGYPETRRRIEAAGIETISVRMSEFRKGDGSLTCLSILFE